MRLTRQTDYAIRALMFCARKPGHAATVVEIAESFRIPRPFLFKIIRSLGDAGLIETLRGRHGGVRLLRDPHTITVADVVRVCEPNVALAECFWDADSLCPIVGSCRLSSVFDEALAAFMARLERHTIADLVEGQTGRAMELVGAV